MGSGTPTVSYNSPVNSLAQSSQLARHPKQKGKYSAAVKKYGTKKPRRSAATFQKKLYVFQNMGPDAPNKFTRSDKNICLKGLLPPISIEASESEIRKEICALIHSGYCSTHMEISPTDFEFINMSGKQASVACCKENFECNGRAVRELSGSGSIYVRLTKSIDLEEVQTISSDDDDVSLPVGPFHFGSGSDAPVTSTGSGLSSSDTINSCSSGLCTSHITTSGINSLSSHASSDLSSHTASRDDGLSSFHTTGSFSRLSAGQSTSHTSTTTSSISSLSSCTTRSHSDLSSSRTSNSHSTGQSSSHTTTSDSSQLSSHNTISGSSMSSSDTETILYDIPTITPDTGNEVPIVQEDLTDQDSTHASLFLSSYEEGNSTLVLDITNLREIFPNIPLSQLEYLYKLSSYSLSNTIEFLTNTPTFASLCGLAADSTITTALEESPRIRLESDDLDEDWLAAALAFYKHNKFDKHASLRITIRGQPGIDTGGVRRQFFKPGARLVS